jgi:hypothetical protein
MKKALAGVLVASLLGLAATGAMAAQPYFQVWFDPAFQVAQSACQPQNTFAQLYVVMHNFDPYPMAGAAFSIDYPPALSWAGDVAPSGALTNGDSRSNFPGPGLGGITIGFGYGKLGPGILALTVNVLWTANCDCYYGAQHIVVRGYRYNDPNGTADPVGVRDEDFENVPAVGMTSLICGAVPAKSSTWGAVKALYR